MWWACDATPPPCYNPIGMCVNPFSYGSLLIVCLKTKSNIHFAPLWKGLKQIMLSLHHIALSAELIHSVSLAATLKQWKLIFSLSHSRTSVHQCCHANLVRPSSLAHTNGWMLREMIQHCCCGSHSANPPLPIPHWTTGCFLALLKLAAVDFCAGFNKDIIVNGGRVETTLGGSFNSLSTLPRY